MILFITYYFVIGLFVCLFADMTYKPEEMEEQGYSKDSFNNGARIFVICLWPLVIIIAVKNL